MNELNIESYLESLVSRCVAKEIGRLFPQLQHPHQGEDKLLTLEYLQEYLPEKPGALMAVLMYFTPISSC